MVKWERKLKRDTRSYARTHLHEKWKIQHYRHSSEIQSGFFRQKKRRKYFNLCCLTVHWNENKRRCAGKKTRKKMNNINNKLEQNRRKKRRVDAVLKKSRSTCSLNGLVAYFNAYFVVAQSTSINKCVHFDSFFHCVAFVFVRHSWASTWIWNWTILMTANQAKIFKQLVCLC